MSPVLPGEVSDGDARPSGPARPPDPVDVLLNVLGEIVVYDMCDVLYVNATWCNVCCQESLWRAFLDVENGLKIWIKI